MIVNAIRFRIPSLLIALVLLAGTSNLQADLITNPPMTIDLQVTINPIIVSNGDGSNTAEFFGTAVQEAQIKDYIDTIWAQAGIDIAWQTAETWDNTFANIGTIGNNSPRPTSDLSTVVANANAAGISDANPDVINIFFVEIAAGFSDTSENTVNGLAFVGGNGITQHVGDNLPGFLGGREVIASVVAHEIGHNLGLPHIVEAENLMQEGGAPNQGERLNAAQIATVRGSSFARAVPEPGSAALLLVFGIGICARRRR